VIREIGTERKMVAEEMYLWGYKHSETGIEVLQASKCKELLTTVNAIDISSERQELLFDRELGFFDSVKDVFHKVVEDRADELVRAHMRFSEYLGAKRFETVTPVLPPDVLGIYIMIPNPSF
jgi:hypothetical protein